MKAWDAICIGYVLFFTLFTSLLKMNWIMPGVKWNAIREGMRFIKSDMYRNLPKIKKAI